MGQYTKIAAGEKGIHRPERKRLQLCATNPKGPPYIQRDGVDTFYQRWLPRPAFYPIGGDACNFSVVCSQATPIRLTLDELVNRQPDCTVSHSNGPHSFNLVLPHRGHWI